MRVPPSEWVMRHLRAGGLVAAGMIIGAAVWMSVHQHNFSVLYMEKERLRLENEELKKTLEPYRKTQSRSSEIREIAVQLYTPPGGEATDEMTAMELRRKLAADLDLLRGKPPETAAEAMIVARRIISNKVYTLDRDAEYRLSVDIVLIKSGVLTIWAEVRPFIRED
jgi:hypothetical protein